MVESSGVEHSDKVLMMTGDFVQLVCRSLGELYLPNDAHGTVGLRDLLETSLVKEAEQPGPEVKKEVADAMMRAMALSSHAILAVGMNCVEEHGGEGAVREMLEKLANFCGIEFVGLKTEPPTEH